MKSNHILIQYLQCLSGLNDNNMNDAWLKDIMSQKFLNSDLSRIIMLKAMIKDGVLYGAYKKAEIMEYVYRVYMDYEYVRAIHPDARIRNIQRYGISDIRDVLENALNEWHENAVNDVLIYDERYIYIKDVGESGKELAKFTKQLSEMLLKKYFSIELKEPLKIHSDLCRDDEDMDVFGTSLYRSRVFEDIQYCPLCEEVNTDLLRVVHILPAMYCDTIAEILDKNNGIILCQNHAEEYLKGKFWFKENGFVKNNGSAIVTEQMHLSIHVKNRARRNYISKYEKLNCSKE